MPVKTATVNVSNRCICNVCKATESSALGPIDDLLFTYFEQDDKENYPDYLLTQGVSRELLHYDVKAQGAKTDVCWIVEQREIMLMRRTCGSWDSP